MVARVEQDEGEDTIQHVNEVLSMLLVLYNVAACPEGVGGELCPELFVVVDLPVHLQEKPSSLFSTKEPERLVTGGWVDNGEALVGEVAVADLVQPTPVRAAVLEPARELKHADSLPLRVIGTSQHCQYATHFR